MKKNLLVGVLILPLICLALWAVFLGVRLKNSDEIRLPIAGYDPRDLLSGRYLAYQIDWQKADCNQFENKTCPKDEFCKEERWGRMCRFYVSELKANVLDDLFRKRNDDNLVFEVVFAYKKGYSPIAKALLVNGKDWQEALKDKWDGLNERHSR